MANGWIEQLRLEPSPEGGYYRQTYETTQQVSTPNGDRNLLSAIYYLLTQDSPIGYFHRNASAITHFYHAGGPVDYLLISPDGVLSNITLGPEVDRGQVLTFTAPGECWKSSHLPKDVVECLISEVVAPGFDGRDHEMAAVELFERLFPQLVDQVRKFILS